MEDTAISFTYDHRALKTRLPVRSALFKQRTGGLVVRWVTTSEYPLLYVVYSFCSFLVVGGVPGLWWSERRAVFAGGARTQDEPGDSMVGT
jgi:hypothetical protein